MQKDFHYGIVKVLAYYSGFDPEDAEIIAYASQYVDDATIHKPIKLTKPLEYESPRVRDNEFDPVCTAHKGLQFIEDFKKSVQEQIYLSFHFIPERPYSGEEDYSYVTKPDGQLAQILVFRAISHLKNKYTTENLIRLGIALHTYADTWSHQNFTGTHSHLHNDIENIEIWDGEKWKKIKPYKQFLNNMFPDIGHAEAYEYPDMPFLRWRYIKDKTKEMILRDNPSIFLDAAFHIFEVLSEIHKPRIEWEKLSARINRFFSVKLTESRERLLYLQEVFPEIQLKYDSNKWRRKALKFLTIDDNPITPGFVGKDYKWFYFHNMAYDQRKFVLERIKRL